MSESVSLLNFISFKPLMLYYFLVSYWICYNFLVRLNTYN
ncbi:hypothetical protein SAMN04487995_4428 [Dyadobacter koreensis]|uniref:Uncharacterized protein n=1 Tax=Dyadobacter koreensis TaxID=408657 RepID=A0A1H6YH64_9BACT|nr:hypothetical protein SAMN04487995_4428 [Dyadobacter koreensis]